MSRLAAYALLALFAPTDDMRVRFIVEDDSTDDPVEGGIDEVHVDGLLVDCQDHVPAAAQAPNPVGDTLQVAREPGGRRVGSAPTLRQTRR